MNRIIFSVAICFLAISSFTLSGCAASPGILSPTPSIIAATATSQSLEPTLTPLPVLPSATSLSISTATNIPPARTQTPVPSPTQTPPPPPTQVVLPQLPIFDKDGENMEGRVFGVPLGTNFISFQVVACSPDCNGNPVPDGKGVSSVEFHFYKGTTQSRDSLDDKNLVYTWKENNRPYCSFGGGNICPLWIFKDHENKWPNGTRIDNGGYTLLLRANGKDNGFWTSVINFSIQR